MNELAKPILEGEGGSDYERYLRTDALLRLQKGPDEWVHRDELLFQTVHQSSELWLKLAWNEVEEAGKLVAADDIAAANRLLRRASDCLKLVTSALDMLEHMSPWEYTEVRKVLGHGSGFDSPGFREIRRVAKPLGEAFHAAHERAGLTLVEVYTRGREFDDLYTLAEQLIEFDERVIVWRVRHFKVVQRVIGADVIGTQGTPVEVMGRLIHHSFYPELWDVRNELDADEPARMSFASPLLGCGNFGGVGSAPEFFGQGVARDEAFAIMDRAWESGIHWFDTGDAYGGGASETWIGDWRADRAPDGLRVTTKVFHSTTGTPGDTGLAPDRIRRQVEDSLGRLGVERIDLYLAHEPDPATPLRETIDTFEQLRAEGLIAAWGLSNYDEAGVEEALAHGHPALLQNPFSLLERSDEQDVLPLCTANDIAYVPFGPLQGGWLTGKYRRGEAFPEGSRMTMRPGPYERLVDDAVFDALDRFRAEAESRGVDMATLAFAWVLAHPHVAGAVCGPNRAEQLDPVLAARDLRLDSDEHERIGALFA